MIVDTKINIDARCTGCNICVSLCPTDAISLRISDEGFWYPSVDQGTCVECGKCLTGCPVYGGNGEKNFSSPVSYIGWNKDYETAYKDDFKVEHVKIDTVTELYRLYRSKYVQNYIFKGLLHSLNFPL